ncbi:Ankyrin repeat and protein kinase domain-containing protein 1 [Chionoecetes opilio]|uniref:Ankyrin repeat and protein kinase domain-containing protein 1 n=1 Tax=Chionoecetes opilio TaxID=41210 RepID=A0A8J5CXZ7_CHIOP|nr:Ankyrin repeat and protein kinase domain-containing protein 1 [Chionoecetes opilio]
MDDESDKEVLVAPHKTQRESTVMRERKESARSERHSHCAIEMENLAFKNSEDDLLSSGSNKNKLHYAVRKLCHKKCEELLDEGVQVNSVDETDSSTALHVLAHKASNNKGDQETLKLASLLIERGAQVDAKDSKGNTPLHIAAIEGVYALCEVLIQQAEATQKSLVNCINVKRMTALHLAVQEGQCRVAELLLGRGATPNVKDSMLWFPLHYAMDKGCVTCCRALAPFYPGDTALTKKQEPPLMVAAKKGHYNTFKELSSEKLNVDYQDENNNTALHITAKKGFYKFVIVLLDLHASPEPLNTCGHTPLMSAVTKDREKCVTVLAERGASMTTTPLIKVMFFI